jgi:hypothetical protein
MSQFREEIDFTKGPDHRSRQACWPPGTSIQLDFGTRSNFGRYEKAA